MKKDQIRIEVESTLAKLGFASGQFRWAGCSLNVVIGRTFKTMRFPAGMSRRALTWELGRLTGWIEALSDTYTAENPEMVRKESMPARRKANGKAAPDMAAAMA